VNNDKPDSWTALDDHTVTLGIGAKIRFLSNYTRFEGKLSGADRVGKRIDTAKGK